MVDTVDTILKEEKTLLGHPRGLVVLFFTEMWERFSYYGMRALLTLYLVQHFLYDDTQAGKIYGAYIALVYVMSIIGGSLSDKYLGQRKAVTYGAILLVLGHFGMAFEGSGSKEYISINNAEYSVQSEGRDKNFKLFIDYEGEARRVSFDNISYAVLDGFGPNGRNLRIEQMDADGRGDYRIAKTDRSVLQKVCNLVGAGCAGADPTTTLVYNNNQYVMTAQTSVSADGVKESFYNVDIGDKTIKLTEEKETDLLVLKSENKEKNIEFKAGGEKPVNAEVLARISDGTYSSRSEKQKIYLYILFLSLSLIIAGVGFLKPNISTIVGSLYGAKDIRRDSGFTLFYMGINLGSFLSTWTCGIIAIYWGWAWGFGLAGIGMVAGLITFLTMQHWLEGKAEPPNPAKLKEKVFGPINIEWACYLVGIGVVAVSMMLVMNAHIVGSLLSIVGVLMFIFLIGYSFKLQGKARTKMWAAIYFAVAQIPFWALFEQAGSSLTLFTSRLVDTNILGWDVPTPVFQSLNAGFIFIFAPLIALMWIGLAKRKLEPSTPVKFAFGVMGAGLGFLILAIGMNSTGYDASSSLLTPVFFIFAIYWIHTMAELLLSPVGLSAMTKLAPVQAVGLMMGAWFLYSGIGNGVSGAIAAASGAETIGGEIIDKAGAKSNYLSVFSSVGWIGIGIGCVMLLISPIVKGWMDDYEDEDEVLMDPVGQN